MNPYNSNAQMMAPVAAAGSAPNAALGVPSGAPAPTASHSTSPTSAPTRSAPASQFTRGVRYARSATVVTLSRGMFLFFTIGMPVAMFLLFNGLFGKEAAGDTSYGTLIMIRMAAYGGLGAAINTGALIQLERTNGWLRQLMVAGLTPRAFVAGRMAAAMGVVLPVLTAVFLCGIAFAGVRMSPGAALLSLLQLWIGMIPMILLGLVIALALKPTAAQPVITIGMMALAMLGGLWFPAELFPGWLQTVSAFTPSRWLGELGTWSVTGAAFPVQGLLVLIAWTVVLGTLAGLLLGRAARTTPRR